MPQIASEDQWQVATPESVGMDGGKLFALAARFEDWKEANLHGVVVARHGKLGAHPCGICPELDVSAVIHYVLLHGPARAVDPV